MRAVENAIPWRERALQSGVTLQTICEHVGSGGTTVDLAKLWGVPHGKLMYWIRSDASREKQFNAACADRNEYTIEKILGELRKLAASDIRLYFNEDGSLKPVAEFPEDGGGCVSSIEVEELYEHSGRQKRQIGWTKKIKFWDKLKAIELIGKNLAQFTDRARVDVHVTLEELISQSKQRDIQPVNTTPDALALPAPSEPVDIEATPNTVDIEATPDETPV